MSTILIAALIMLCTIGLFVLFTFINRNNQSKRSKMLLHTFSELASEKGLSFSSQEFLKQRIIAVDGIKRVVMVLDFAQSDTVTSINLADVRYCGFYKDIVTVDVGTRKKPDLKPYLRSAGVKFSFSNGADITVAFYEDHINSIYEINELTEKAKDWEITFSKLLVKEAQSRA